MKRLLLTVEGDDEDAVLDTLRVIGEVGLPSTDAAGKAETSDGVIVSWIWKPVDEE